MKMEETFKFWVAMEYALKEDIVIYPKDFSLYVRFNPYKYRFCLYNFIEDAEYYKNEIINSQEFFDNHKDDKWGYRLLNKKFNIGQFVEYGGDYARIVGFYQDNLMWKYEVKLSPSSSKVVTVREDNLSEVKELI